MNERGERMEKNDGWKGKSGWKGIEGKWGTERRGGKWQGRHILRTKYLSMTGGLEQKLINEC